MGLSFLTPFFLAGFLALGVPIVIHLIRRHQGKTLEFPSLMFLRQLPVQSVKRRSIRDWPLLLLRAGALTLIALAFARPVLQLGETEEGTAQDALREVVITMDRSWSMAAGARWERAVEEANSVLDGLVNPDRVSLVVFDGIGRVVVEPTLDPGRVRQALDTIGPGWGGTQIGAGLQASSGILEASDRSRREVVLISDYQRRGWEDGPRDRLPASTEFVTVDVGDDGIGSMVVSDVALEHSFTGGRQRVQPVARVIRQGEAAPTTGELVLELDDQEASRRPVELPNEGALSVAFDPITLPEEGLRGFVRLETPGEAPGEPFRFVVSPREVLSILLVEDGGSGTGSPYLLNALNVPGGPPVRVETRAGTAIGAGELADVDLVILNDVELPSGAAGTILRDHVRSGGGLLAVTGPESRPVAWDPEWSAFLPGEVGEVVERNPARGASLAQVDRDHPIFIPFRGVGGSGLGTPRFFRYREFDLHQLPSTDDEGPAPEATDRGPRILARFDDGSPALAQRTVGAGRVLVWTSTLDNSWTDFALHPVFVPIVREIAQFAAARSEGVPYFTVGQPVDARFLLTEAGLLQEDPEAPQDSGAPGAPEGEVLGLLVSPDGSGMELRTTGSAPIQLSEPGFYEVRESEEDAASGWTLAANPDVREADPARIDPEELALAASPSPTDPGGGSASTEGDLLDSTDPRTALVEGERRQGAWRFLLLGALLLLLGETILSGRRKPLARTVSG